MSVGPGLYTFAVASEAEASVGKPAAPSRRRRWRDYKTAAGGRPVRDFLEALTDGELAEVVAAMKEVSVEGLVAAKHLRGDLYEVRADAATRSFRVLFATETRLKDWRSRRKPRK